MKVTTTVRLSQENYNRVQKSARKHKMTFGMMINRFVEEAWPSIRSTRKIKNGRREVRCDHCGYKWISEAQHPRCSQCRRTIKQ